jgi:hypothetical protein
VPPVRVQAIKRLHNRRDFGGIVRLIRETMNVGVSLTLHWTSGPPPHEKAKAWIKIPPDMPYYGTPEFKALKMDMFILKSFRDKSAWDEFAIVVAHELSHVILDSIAHQLRDEEKAVDLTAMLLGFSYLYRCAAHTTRRTGLNTYQRSHLGYLSEREINAASKALVPYEMRARYVATEIIKASSGLLALVGICLSVWAVESVSTKWSAHNAAVAEASQLIGQVPIRYNPHLTLIGVRAGLASITKTFQVDSGLRDLAVFSAKQHLVCAAKGANIAKGVSYLYEYWRDTGEFVTRIEVSSCP